MPALKVRPNAAGLLTVENRLRPKPRNSTPLSCPALNHAPLGSVALTVHTPPVTQQEKPTQKVFSGRSVTSLTVQPSGSPDEQPPVDSRTLTTTCRVSPSQPAPSPFAFAMTFSSPLPVTISFLCPDALALAGSYAQPASD